MDDGPNYCSTCVDSCSIMFWLIWIISINVNSRLSSKSKSTGQARYALTVALQKAKIISGAGPTLTSGASLGRFGDCSEDWLELVLVLIRSKLGDHWWNKCGVSSQEKIKISPSWIYHGWWQGGRAHCEGKAVRWTMWTTGGEILVVQVGYLR